MLKITFCLLVLGGLTLVRCLTSTSGESDVVDESLDGYDDDKHVTSTPSVPPEQIRLMIKQLDEDLDELEGKGGIVLKRVRRSVDNKSHWCCKVKDPGQVAERQVIKSRVIHKTVKVTTYDKCGGFGWSRCAALKDKVMTVVEYYQDTSYSQIVPADLFADGCPDGKEVCCKGYYYDPKMKNCLTIAELKKFTTVVKEFKDELGIISEYFGK